MFGVSTRESTTSEQLWESHWSGTLPSVDVPSSMISRENRCLSFIPAAPRIVRSERAFLPCLPITLPRSLGATLKRRIVPSPSAIASTETTSGLSTSDRAISEASLAMRETASPSARASTSWVIAHTSWESRATPCSSPSSRLSEIFQRGTLTGEATVHAPGDLFWIALEHGGVPAKESHMIESLREQEEYTAGRKGDGNL